MNDALDFGITTPMTHGSIQPGELARWAEEHKFESLWTGEHSHVPVTRTTPFPGGGELPEFYKHHYDPFIALTAAAASTTNLKIGTSVAVIPDHHPITLAKKVATLDRISRGRFVFGIGSGWLAEEMENHGVAFKDRWKYTRECVLAIRRMWSDEEAQYHGDFVDFDPLWLFPKPFQPGGPPVILGASGEYALKRVVDYCDGWFPLDGVPGLDLAKEIERLKQLAEESGRDFASLDLSVIVAYEVIGSSGEVEHLERLARLGFKRIVFWMEPLAPEKQWPILERFSTNMRSLLGR